MMTIEQVLRAMQPAWKLANRTDDDGKFLRPDYRQALVDVWEDIVVANHTYQKQQYDPSMNLNVASAKLPREDAK